MQLSVANQKTEFDPNHGEFSDDSKCELLHFIDRKCVADNYDNVEYALQRY